MAAIGRRDRTIVTVAGVAPDLDGLGAIAELLTRNTSHPLYWYSEYHHILAHNLGFGVATAVAALAIARRRVVTGCLAFFAFHLHLVGDLVGSRGPDGSQWPIRYLLPFAAEPTFAWSGQWALNAWQNVALTVTLLGLVIWLAWKRGFSPVQMVSMRADRVFIDTLRARFPPGGKQLGVS